MKTVSWTNNLESSAVLFSKETASRAALPVSNWKSTKDSLRLRQHWWWPSHIVDRNTTHLQAKNDEPCRWWEKSEVRESLSMASHFRSWLLCLLPLPFWEKICRYYLTTKLFEKLKRFELMTLTSHIKQTYKSHQTTFHIFLNNVFFLWFVCSWL